jgi:mannose-6-phosphate isomerase-like protein (cupin superfamily)
VAYLLEIPMQAEIRRGSEFQELETPERCSIAEISGISNGDLLSIARARVKPGVTTAWHRLRGVSERYIIVSGKGLVELSGLASAEVFPGDTVVIPAETPQRITNTGGEDLVFYCVCAPPFRLPCYESLE